MIGSGYLFCANFIYLTCLAHERENYGYAFPTTPSYSQRLVLNENHPPIYRRNVDDRNFDHNHGHDHGHGYPGWGPGQGPRQPPRHTHTATEVDASKRVGIPAGTVEDVVNRDPINRNKVRSSDFDRMTTHDNDKKIFFPPDLKQIASTKSTSTFDRINSKNCSFGLCDVVDDYPTEQIRNSLIRSQELQQYFANFNIWFTVGNRNKFTDDGEEPLCEVKTHTRFPKSAVNTNKIEKLLVNIDNFQQGIVFETCAEKQMPCKYSESFPGGYVSVCKQKYITRRLLVAGDESDKPVFDNFEIPSCCICLVKKV